MTAVNASQVLLNTDTLGICHVLPQQVDDASFKRSSELLQKNHEKFHIFFSEMGMHNHIVHHLLTLLALGASPQELQQAYDHNTGYQRNRVRGSKKTEQDFSDPKTFKENLGQKDLYDDYVTFFEKEIDRMGWQDAVTKYLFSRDENAEEMMARMFGGLYHPLIHLGFGIEFRQPAIIAEALAQAAVHQRSVDYLLKMEQAAAASPSRPSKTLPQLLSDVRGSPKIRQEQMHGARDDVIALASQWRVPPSELARKTAEMINAAVFLAGAAQRPDKAVKFDFYTMHCVTSSVFFSVFLEQEWMRQEDKVRMLEWKGRLDLAWYVICGCPELREKEVTGYKPQKEGQGWSELLEDVKGFVDDGHLAKLVRAIKNGEAVCAEYEGEEAFLVKGDMWQKLGHMAYDSLRFSGGPNWLFNAGTNGAWSSVPSRSNL